MQKYAFYIKATVTSTLTVSFNFARAPISAYALVSASISASMPLSLFPIRYLVSLSLTLVIIYE